MSSAKSLKSPNKTRPVMDCLPHFMTIHLLAVGDILLRTTNKPHGDAGRKSQGTITVGRIHPLGSMNVCRTCRVSINPVKVEILILNFDLIETRQEKSHRAVNMSVSHS